MMMPEPSQSHNAINTETLGGLQRSTSQEAIDFEDACKLGVPYGGNSNETVKVRAPFFLLQ